jgi:hypothetical protein
VHGETGFMAATSDEMSEYATLLAHEPARHRRMSENGRHHLERTLGNADACWEAWQAVLTANPDAVEM